MCDHSADPDQMLYFAKAGLPQYFWFVWYLAAYDKKRMPKHPSSVDQII